MVGERTVRERRRRRQQSGIALTSAVAIVAAPGLIACRSMADVTALFRPEDWTLNGGATIQSGALQLTRTTAGYQARSAVFGTSPKLSQGFTCPVYYNPFRT